MRSAADGRGLFVVFIIPNPVSARKYKKSDKRSHGNLRRGRGPLRSRKRSLRSGRSPLPPRARAICQAFFHRVGGNGKKNHFGLCQVGAESASLRIICLIRSSRLVLFFVLNCRKMGYVPLPMLRISDGFSVAFDSSVTGVLLMLVNEASFLHSRCIDLIAGIWRN